MPVRVGLEPWGCNDRCRVDKSVERARTDGTGNMKRKSLGGAFCVFPIHQEADAIV